MISDVCLFVESYLEREFIFISSQTPNDALIHTQRFMVQT